eukprot:4007400-Amphidinium_carterae.1
MRQITLAHLLYTLDLLEVWTLLWQEQLGCQCFAVREAPTAYFKAQFRSICSIAKILRKSGWQPAPQCPHQHTSNVDPKACIENPKAMLVTLGGLVFKVFLDAG